MSKFDEYEAHMRSHYPSEKGKRWGFHMKAARLAKRAGQTGSYHMHVKEAAKCRVTKRKRSRSRRQPLKPVR